MGIKIKNLQTGEFEKFNIPALKGEKGEPGEIEPSEKVDYIGKQHSKLRDTMNANVDYIIKTAIGEFNYLDYEGQQITATNTLEGYAKSAILKGQTLVNLFNKHISDVKYGKNTTSTIEEDGSITISGTWWAGFKIPVKANTQYTLFATSKKNNGKIAICDDAVINGIAAYPNLQENTSIIKTFTTKDDTNLRLVLYVGAYTNIILLEGDYTNVDIPYFESMQSVKMPVLTTTGKNLFDESKHTSLLESSMVDGKEAFKFETGYAITSKNTIVSNKTFEFKENTQYTIRVIHKASGNSDFMCIRFFYSDGSDSAGGVKRDTDWTEYFFSSSANKTITAITNDSGGSSGRIDYIMKGELGLFEGIATSYEPYKSNILTVNEDVTLRGIGDVKDELNLLTGEITQRIVEVVLDGSEDWFAEDDRFTLEGVENFLPNRWSLLLSDKYPSYSSLHSITQYPSYIMGNGWAQGFHIRDVALFPNPKNQLSEFKEYLSQNPVTVQYQSATESIKTVDLSDNHVYSYKGTTHYDCSSAEGSLVPTLSVKVPTDTQLTIQEQKATTQTLLIKNVDLQQSIKEVQAMNLAFNTVLYNSFNSIREEVEDIKKHVSTNENLEGSF